MIKRKKPDISLIIIDEASNNNGFKSDPPHGFDNYPQLPKPRPVRRRTITLVENVKANIHLLKDKKLWYV